MELSVIIPALNEAGALPLLIGDLKQQQGCELEIVVADGGSTDATVALAQTAGAMVVRAPRGRGAQMNAGAQLARGEWLLFLHADSRLPSPTLLQEALSGLKAEIAGSKSERVAGHFPLRFARNEPGHGFLFRYLEGKTALNRRYTINGDQGALLSARFFRELGAYDTRLPFLEDQRLAAKVQAQGRWIVLPGQLITSARRFELEGHRPRLILMTLMMALHEAGADEFFAEAPQVYAALGASAGDTRSFSMTPAAAPSASAGGERSFSRAPAAAQDRTGKLDLFAFHRLIRRLLWRARWKRMACILLRCGRFVRRNTWQLFYYRDQRRARQGHYPALAFYDRYLNRLIANPAGDVLATLLMCAWFFAWLPLAERR